ncbi:MAG: aminotransferase [Rhizobium sp. 63-7]|nr:MAG: aminotransferase [Rhizobium sp. 63-7]
MDNPTWLSLDRAAGDLEGQLYRALRDHILAGGIAAGQPLPATRALAAALGVGRSTVVGAYDRLKAEGYVEGRAGSATRVAGLAPPLLEGWGAVRPPASSFAPEPVSSGMLVPGVPDVEDFPHAAWARCLAARGRALRVHDLGYDDVCGLPMLRQAVLDHVAVTRGVVAKAGQVLIVPSTRAAIDLLGRLLLPPQGGREAVAWIEEPGYSAAQGLLRRAGAQLVPVACDEAGIHLAKAGGLAPRLIYVTPSHQYPTGVTMSLQRRLALLDFARSQGALVLEDDYDSEFQYGSRPIAALQGIDRGEVVAYLGTFSKVLAPGLRVAYLIVPPRLLPQVAVEQRLRGLAVPVHIQAALADFMREGRLRAYLRRMTVRYAERMAATVAALERHCGTWLQIASGSGGLQLAAWFRDPGIDDRAVARLLNAEGYGLKPMSDLFLGPPRPGLLFGIARVRPDEIDRVARRIGSLFDDAFHRRAG